MIRSEHFIPLISTSNTAKYKNTDPIMLDRYNKQIWKSEAYELYIDEIKCNARSAIVGKTDMNSHHSDRG